MEVKYNVVKKSDNIDTHLFTYQSRHYCNQNNFQIFSLVYLLTFIKNVTLTLLLQCNIRLRRNRYRRDVRLLNRRINRNKIFLVLIFCFINPSGQINLNSPIIINQCSINTKSYISIRILKGLYNMYQNNNSNHFNQLFLYDFH